MKRLLLFCFGIILTVALLAQSPFLKKYSGVYNIGIDGVEAYALKDDGSCIWVFGWISNGKLQTQKKTGTWSAKNGYIKIIINGNTGLIIEEYLFKNGSFVNNSDSNRFLKKVNK